MTPEVTSLNVPDENRHCAWVVGDEPCMLLGGSRNANYAKPAG